MALSMLRRNRCFLSKQEDPSRQLLHPWYHGSRRSSKRSKTKNIYVYMHTYMYLYSYRQFVQLQCCSLSLCMSTMDLLLHLSEVQRWTFRAVAWLQQCKSWHWLAGILSEYTPGYPMSQFPRLQPTACLVKGISCEWLHYTVVDRSSPASFWITTSKSLLTVSLNCHCWGWEGECFLLKSS